MSAAAVRCYIAARSAQVGSLTRYSLNPRVPSKPNRPPGTAPSKRGRARSGDSRMSNVNTATPPQGLAGYSINWNTAALKAITFGLNQIPVVGGILSTIVGIFWPSSGPDVCVEIEQNVKNLIDQSISLDDYKQAQDALGSASHNSGLVGVLNN